MWYQASPLCTGGRYGPLQQNITNYHFMDWSDRLWILGFCTCRQELVGLPSCLAFTQTVRDVDMFLRKVQYWKWNSCVFLQQSFWRTTSFTWVQATQNTEECIGTVLWGQRERANVTEGGDPLCWDKPYLLQVPGGRISGYSRWRAPRHPEHTPELTFLRHCVKDFARWATGSNAAAQARGRFLGQQTKNPRITVWR